MFLTSTMWMTTPTISSTGRTACTGSRNKSSNDRDPKGAHFEHREPAAKVSMKITLSHGKSRAQTDVFQTPYVRRLECRGHLRIRRRVAADHRFRRHKLSH